MSSTQCLIIPDEVLDTMICSKCSNYLSVYPVKVYPDKSIKCGRCVEDDDLGMLSVANELMKNMYFKCVNRFEGCTAVLKPCEVSFHESFCCHDYYDCPICDCKHLTAFKLLTHFKMQHKRNIMTKPDLMILLDKIWTKHFLYVHKNCIFMFNIALDSVHREISCTCTHVGPNEISRELSYQIRFVAMENQKIDSPVQSFDQNCDVEPFKIELDVAWTFVRFEFILKENSINKLSFMQIQTSVDLEDEAESDVASSTVERSNESLNSTVSMFDEHMIGRKICLTEEFETSYPDWVLSSCKTMVYNTNDTTFKLQACCPICDQLYHIRHAFYYCDENAEKHMACCNCYKQQKLCSNGFPFTKNNTLTEMYCKLMFYCKWGCGQAFTSWTLERHEHMCDIRLPIVCPVVNCENSICANTYVLHKHITEKHRSTEIRFYANSNCVIPFDSLQDKENVLLYMHDVIVVLFVERRNLNKICHITAITNADSKKYRVVAIINNNEVKCDGKFTLTKGQSARVILKLCLS